MMFLWFKGKTAVILILSFDFVIEDLCLALYKSNWYLIFQVGLTVSVAAVTQPSVLSLFSYSWNYSVALLCSSVGDIMAQFEKRIVQGGAMSGQCIRIVRFLQWQQQSNQLLKLLIALNKPNLSKCITWLLWIALGYSSYIWNILYFLSNHN